VSDRTASKIRIILSGLLISLESGLDPYSTRRYLLILEYWTLSNEQHHYDNTVLGMHLTETMDERYSTAGEEARRNTNNQAVN